MSPPRVSLDLDRGVFVILDEHGRVAYEPDLARFDRCSEILDWFAQVAGKAWVDDETLGQFVRLVCDRLAVQSTLCSWGRDAGRIDPGAVARRTATQ